MNVGRVMKVLVVSLTAVVAAGVGPAAASHAASRPVSHVSAAKATLGTFKGDWYGHTRALVFDSAGHAVEKVGDGCCDPIINLRFTISHVKGTTAKATAKAVVTKVKVKDPSEFSSQHPAPSVGDKGKLKLKHGIITEPFIDSFYCDPAREGHGACGA